jgi:hypothetical protein
MTPLMDFLKFWQFSDATIYIQLGTKIREFYSAALAGRKMKVDDHDADTLSPECQSNSSVGL